jgi:hypothetical protein
MNVASSASRTGSAPKRSATPSGSHRASSWASREDVSQHPGAADGQLRLGQAARDGQLGHDPDYPPKVKVEPVELTTSSFPIRWASRTKASAPVQCWGTR